ncbi:hypothetical protein [Janthinobacterium sp. FT14W]|uniref:hypothetical protein n=1 Tax=Janthinobacterium sp. FT14W TaxID=2654253 RepID=UPI00186ACAD5|nr:hypothetical protein [Janthinobacterium sp. FT14W]
MAWGQTPPLALPRLAAVLHGREELGQAVRGVVAQAQAQYARTTSAWISSRVST